LSNYVGKLCVIRKLSVKFYLAYFPLTRPIVGSLTLIDRCLASQIAWTKHWWVLTTDRRNLNVHRRFDKALTTPIRSSIKEFSIQWLHFDIHCVLVLHLKPPRDQWRSTLTMWRGSIFNRFLHYRINVLQSRTTLRSRKRKTPERFNVIFVVHRTRIENEFQ